MSISDNVLNISEYESESSESIFSVSDTDFSVSAVGFYATDIESRI